MGDERDATVWEARSRGYGLLARLITRGPGAVGPSLAAAGLGGFDPDPEQAAADHHRWLSREFLPWESVYLTEDRLLGGERADLLAGAAAGLPLAPADPDHLGRELEIAAWLTGAIGDAHADRQFAEVDRVSARLASFLASHLGAWVGFPALALAGVPGWGPALQVAAELVASHGVTPLLPPTPARDPLDPRAGLRDVADWLATPLATGVAWTHAALQALGTETRIPTGFGTRTDQLESLLRNAADHRRVGDAAVAIDRELVRWEQAWGSSPWAVRVRHAREVVSRLGAAPAPRAIP